MGNKSKSNQPKIRNQQGTSAGSLANGAIVRQTKMESHRGPIPSAAEMERYAQINPTLPDRIMSMVESQSEHRQIIEKIAVTDAGKQRTLGTVCAAAIGLAAIAGGTACIIAGYSAEGIVSILGTIVTLAGAFIYGTNSNKKERMQKWKEVQPPN